MASKSEPLSHPTLNCKIIGKHYDTVTQYRGLKYASIPSRWHESIPLDTLPTDADGIYDATQFGPSCPHKRGAQAADLALVGDATLRCEEGQGETEKMDEFECLTVDFTVPKTVTNPTEGGGRGRREGESKGLPVFIWIHGGGLSHGSTSWPQYSLTNFIARSAAIGKPVIGVSINYRIGILGFLASSSLGIKGNFGFKDQALAFKWVRKHISGFGGDPRNVTAAGESAGGISLSVLLCSEKKELFERVVMMSGEASLRKPRGWGWHEEMLQDQLSFFELDGKRLGKEEIGKRLREWDAVDMCQRLPMAQHFCGVVDGKWMKSECSLGVLGDGRSEVGKRAWCREFVVGDTGGDGTVLKARILDNPHALQTLHTLCSKHLTPPESKALLSAYKLPPPPPSPSSPKSQHQPYNQAKHYNSLLQLATDLRFYLPTLTLYAGLLSTTPPRNVSRYHFHVPNPLPGSFTGLASHELDVAYLLQNWNGVFDERDQSIARAMADHLIGFVCGQGWAGDGLGGEKGDVVVFNGACGDEKGTVRRVSAKEYDRVWRNGRGKLLVGIGAERVWALAEEWQGVRGEVEESGGLKAKL